MKKLIKPYKLLIIDDDEEDFFLIKDYLEDFNNNDYEIDNVTNFEEGLEALKSKKYDIYLIDNLLGAGTGIELIEKAISEGNTNPKILLTGIGNREIDIKAIEIGADDYFPKELLNPEMLERIIRHSIERHEQKVILEQQNIRFKNLFEQSIDPIYITDKDTNLLQVNSAFLKLFELNQEQVLGKSLKQFFKDIEEYSKFLNKNNEEGFVQNFGVQLIKEDIVLDTLISSSPLLDFENTRIGYQGIIHDITEQKKAEYGLRISDQSNLTNRMARMIAHEVRNPLTNITLAVNQIIDSNEDHELYLDMISRNSGRINTLINDLLNSTKIADLSFDNTYIEDIIDIAIEHTIDRIKLKGVDLTLPENSEKTTVVADKETLAMVFTNIITNAIEATEGIEHPSISIKISSDDKCSYVTITDNGKGMDKETKENLFKAFFSKRQGGMGLGMTTVQNIVYKHNGEIEVESEEGKGTSFIIALPKK